MKNPIKECPCSSESLVCFSALNYESHFYVVGLLVYKHSVTLRVKICTDRWTKFTEGFMIFLCHSKQMLRQYLQADHACFLPQCVYYSLCLKITIDAHVKGENRTLHVTQMQVIIIHIKICIKNVSRNLGTSRRE
jgi:hypothetical protein